MTSSVLVPPVPLVPPGGAPPQGRPGAYPPPPVTVPAPARSGWGDERTGTQGHGQQHHEQYGTWGAFRTPTGPVGDPPVPLPALRSWSHPGALVAGALLLALVAGVIGGGVGAYLERNGSIAGAALLQGSAEDSGHAPGSVGDIAAAVLPGVVTLHVQGSRKGGIGTGFVLDQQGHILTNNHVVAPAVPDGDISVTFSNGEVSGAEIVGQDSGYDLAVIKVKGVAGLRPLTLGDSDSVRVGDLVVAVGAPYNLAGTVTSGIISATERPITAGGEKGDGSDAGYVDALQTDAPINPGNSGGPLVDSKARVIGINSAIRVAGNGSNRDSAPGGSIGLGFAIPINQAKRIAEELISTGRATHPVIGVSLDMEYAGDGARVEDEGGSGPPVTPGSPADKAGIRPGDLITRADGVRVHSARELIAKIRSHRPGDRLKLTLERDSEERTLELALGGAVSG